MNLDELSRELRQMEDRLREIEALMKVGFIEKADETENTSWDTIHYDMGQVMNTSRRARLDLQARINF